MTAEMCEELFKEQSLDTKRHVAVILMELQKAEHKHPHWPTDEDGGDFIHAAAIVAEESGELIRASLQFAYEGGRYYDMHKEAIQVGAMAIRFLNNAPELKEVSNG